VILASGLTASLASMHFFYWFFPLIFSVIPTVGFLREKSSVIDYGMIMTIVSYFLINEGLPLTVLNVILVVGLLFLLVGVWFFARYLLLLDRIERSSRKGAQGEDIISFTRSARKFMVRGIFTNTLLGAFIAIIASLMGAYSSLGRVTQGRIENILMIVFSFLLFLVIYKMISLMASEDE